MSEQTTYEFLYAPQGAVLDEYYTSRDRVTLIMGPLGSGKTTVSCMRVFDQICEQEPDAHGTRKSRWIAVRNTYPDLTGTTIKDWSDLYHNEHTNLGKFNKDFPPTHHLDFDLDDGTRVIAEVVFLALDRPDSVRKLRGLQATGFWLNEVKELDKSIVDMCDGRHGRYPKDVNPTWHGIIGDTNAPDTDHWYYELAENEHPLNWTFLRQPGGVTGTVTGPPSARITTWQPNNNAENINNLPDGYYINQIQGKKDDWIRVNLANEYGSVSTGKPIYQGVWNDAVHTAEYKLLPIPSVNKILIGFDFGRTPAATIGQLMPNGKLRVLRELVSTGMGIRTFMDSTVIPCLESDFAKFDIKEMEAYGDPSGVAKSGNDENSPIGILNDEYNLTTYPTATNIPLRRWEAVNDFLMNTIDGVQAFELSKCCEVIRKGFNGGYQFRRLNVGGEKYAEAADKNKFSHCFVFDTAIDTGIDKKAISDVEVGDLVLTPFGYKPVVATMSSLVNELIELELSDGRVIVCTPNHPFFTSDGIKRADALQYLPLVSKEDKVSKKWVEQVNIKYKNLTALSSTKSQKGILKLAIRPTVKLSTCTVMFGNFAMERFQKGFKFTISTIIKLITELKTLSLCRVLSIPDTTANLWQEPSKQNSTWRTLGRWLLNGIGQKKVGSGTANMQSAQQQRGKLLSMNALGAKKNIKQKLARLKKAFVVCRVKVWQGKRQELTMLSENVVFAAESLKQTNTQNEKHAVRVVTARLLPQKDTVRVYDLMVKDAECFYANGILVHNCHDALQYLAQGAQGEINYEWLDKHLANSDSNQSVIADTTSGY